MGERRTLIATDVMGRGGVDRYVADLVTVLDRRGHDVIVAVEETSGSALLDPATTSRRTTLGLRLYHRRHHDTDLRSDARSLLRRHRPDWLVVVCGIPWSCLPLREVAAEAALPTVTVEAYVPDDLELTTIQRDRIAALYRCAKAVVFLGEENRSVMRALVGLDGVMSTVVPPGVDLPAIERAGRAIAERGAAWRRRAGRSPVRFVTVGRLVRQKGIDVLLDAAMLLERIDPWMIDVFGDGDDRVTLEQTATRITAGPVRFHGWAGDLDETFASHDILVVPSRSEGVPYVVLHAMAAGIPIIGTDVGGIADALNGGAAGFVVPTEHPAALARSMVAAAADYEASLVRAAHARRRVRADYDVSKNHGRVADLVT